MGTTVLGAACNRGASERAHSESQETWCLAACRAIVDAECGRVGTGEKDLPVCASACVAEGRTYAAASCERQRRAYLVCVAESDFECAAGGCSAAKCLESGVGVGACGEAFEDYRRCIAPCLHAGTKHRGESVVDARGRKRRLQFELTRVGCAPCPSAAKGAPVGAPCTAATVCAEACCRCDDGPGRYLARACLDGACASAYEACRLAPPGDVCE